MLVGLVICFNPVFYGAAAWSILANDEDIQSLYLLFIIYYLLILI